MSDTELRRVHAFLSGFARRQADRTVELPCGFAAFADEFPNSWSDNHVVVDRTDVAPAELPDLVERAMADERPFRQVGVLDGDFGDACVEPFRQAGYAHETYPVMLHTGPLPARGFGGPDGGHPNDDRPDEAGDITLDEIREPIAAAWRAQLPEAGEEVVRELVDRRAIRRRGAERVDLLGSRTADGEVAAWTDLYLDPALGVAQIEDLMTAEAHRRRGHADAVLGTALRRAAAAGCGTRFLTAENDDWPRHWYARRGFTVIGHSHGFTRA
ncbi:GNAT family N-acetyltransferase [Kitasatospora sp. NPDC004240]